MVGNRGSFRAIIALLFICLTLGSTLVTGKPFKPSNRTGGYTPVKQSLRTVTLGRNALHAFNNDNNNQKSINFTKVSAKSDVNSDSHNSDIYSDSVRSDSRESDWSLQFDPNYFASLNAANHRPIDAMIASPTDSQSKVSSTSSSSSGSSGDNMFYYSPESYGKTNHKNHKTNSFAYLYPSSSSTSTTTTTTSTSTTPSPKTPHNRFGEFSQKGFSDSQSPYSQSYNPSDDKPSSENYNYEETPDEEEEPTYYDTNEENIGRKYYYANRNRPKHYPIHDYYGSDLSSMPTNNENSKIKTMANSEPNTNYGTQEETDIGHTIQTYDGPSAPSRGSVRFPTRHYGSGSSAYYPSYYSSQYPLASENSGVGAGLGGGGGGLGGIGGGGLGGLGGGGLGGLGGGGGGSFFGSGESLLHRSSSWLGPGLAGVILGLGLPLGILMASMLPAMVSVGSLGGLGGIVNTATVGRKKRFIPDFDLLSLNSTQMILNSGVLEILSKYGMSSLEDPKCLTEMFCTFAAEGRHSNKNLVQNIVYNIIDLTPNRLAKWLTIDTLFGAVKHNKCEPIYKCMSSKRVKFKDTERYGN